MKKEGIKSYYQAKIEECEIVTNEKSQDLRRLEAQRNALNAKGNNNSSNLILTPNTDISPFLVRLLKEELQLLQEPGSYVGEVVKVMGKKKVLVKVTIHYILKNNTHTNKLIFKKYRSTLKENSLLISAPTLTLRY